MIEKVMVICVSNNSLEFLLLNFTKFPWVPSDVAARCCYMLGKEGVVPVIMEAFQCFVVVQVQTNQN